MRKSHRDGGLSKQSCKNPYHSFAEGGEVPGTNQNDKNLGRSKKVPSAAEDVYRGGANAKRMNINTSSDQNMGRTQKVKSMAEGMYQGKANAKRFADGGMPGYDNQAPAQQQPAQPQVPPAPARQNFGRPIIGYGRPGDPSMYNGGGIRRINTTAMPQQQQPLPSPGQQVRPQPVSQVPDAQIPRAKGGKWIQGAINPAHKGQLHRELGVPQGKKIPMKDLHRAEHSRNPHIAKQARLAETLRSFHHRSPKR